MATENTSFREAETLANNPTYDCPTQNNVIRQILSHHNIETEIYTDGSKSIHGVGSAYFVPNQKHTFRVKLPDLSSIYTAEALAIEKALEWCSKKHEKDCHSI
nr:unnamed protein product [Callosobruchus chinensis]